MKARCNYILIGILLSIILIPGIYATTIKINTNYNTSSNDWIPFLLNGTSLFNTTGLNNYGLTSTCSNLKFVNGTSEIQYELPNASQYYGGCNNLTEVWIATPFSASNLSINGIIDTPILNHNIWDDSNYIGVWHFGTAPFINNSVKSLGVNSDLYIYRSPPNITNGIFGSAGNFTGTGNYIANNNNNKLYGGFNITIEVWFNLFTGFTDGTNVIVRRHNETAGYENYNLLILASGQPICTIGDTIATANAQYNYAFSPNQWYYFACVYNGTYINLYVNSTLIYVYNISTETGDYIINATSNFSSVIFSVGSSRDGSSTFHGSIDELRISNITRDQDYFTKVWNSRLGSRATSEIIPDDNINEIYEQTLTELIPSNITIIYKTYNKTIQNMEAFLMWNNTNQSYDYKYINNGFDVNNFSQYTFIKTIIPPLITSVNSNISFRWNLTFYSPGLSNSTNSTINNQTIYKIQITSCNDTYSTLAYNISFYDEGIPNNILTNNSLDIAFTQVYINQSNPTNFSFKFENVTNASICIYPKYLNASINAILVYNNSNGYLQRTYYIINGYVDNKTQNLSLYHIKSDIGKIISFSIIDVTNLPVQDAYLYVYRYYVENNTYRTVAIARSDFDGKGVTYLALNDVFYKFIVIKGGLILSDTNQTFITSQTVTIQINPNVLGRTYQIYSDVTSTCSYNNSTENITCTASDVKGISREFCLKVDRSTSLNWVNVCNTCSTGASISLSCNLGNISQKTYYYSLTISGSSIPINIGYIEGLQSIAIYGVIGAIISAFVILTLSFIGRSPSLIIINGVFGLSLLYLFQFINIGYSGIVGVALAGATLIYLIKR